MNGWRQAKLRRGKRGHTKASVTRDTPVKTVRQKRDSLIEDIVERNVQTLLLHPRAIAGKSICEMMTTRTLAEKGVDMTTRYDLISPITST